MRILSSAAMCLVFLLSLSGCTEPPRQQRAIVVEYTPPPAPTIEYLDATIAEGKTTKAQIIEALGEPNDFGTGDDYTYTVYSASNYPKNVIMRIRFVQRDGIDMAKTFNKGYVIIYYTNKGVVRNFSLGGM